jgi:anti-sigma regulatory factor (Ser/Thr protein kinase)
MGTHTAAQRQQADRRNFTRNEHAPKFARAYVRLKLGEWRLRHLTDLIQLVADELVTNAVQHSGGENVMLWLVPTDASVVVHVWDSNPEPPELRAAEDCDEDGRGLAIVSALSVRTGCYPLGVGKTVFAEVAR